MNWRDTFDETIRDGIFALLILQVLSERDKTKQEIHREIGIHTDGVFCKTNSLLMTLDRLRFQKLITSKVIPIDEVHEKTIYHIEPSGKEYLEYGKIHLRNITQALHLFFGQEMSLQAINEKPLS